MQAEKEVDKTPALESQVENTEEYEFREPLTLKMKGSEGFELRVEALGDGYDASVSKLDNEVA